MVFCGIVVLKSDLFLQGLVPFAAIRGRGSQLLPKRSIKEDWHEKRILVFISPSILFCFALLAFSPTVEAFSVPFETVDKGDSSYYRYDDLSFKGTDMLIKNKRTWEHFWKQHTSGILPQPPLPDINFAQEMVIVTILGTQETGGPSTQVLRVNRTRRSKCLHILIEDDETPGQLTVITNPYHIIKLRKIHARSIVFEHQKP